MSVQVCLAAVMAQVGAWVPAQSLELTPADALFVRSGARDAIMSGQVRVLVRFLGFEDALTFLYNNRRSQNTPR